MPQEYSIGCSAELKLTKTTNQMDINPITENKQDELLALLKPLIDFMDTNDYSYFFVSGKDGVCSRYMKGNPNEVVGMLTGMAENTKEVGYILKEVVGVIDFKSN